MPAGTIKLTNNSAVVTGTGTSFTTELAANDFLVAVVGGVTYTLGVKSVESNTGLTLAAAYNGPTTTGLAWTPVPNATLVGITAQVAADVAKAIRGMNLDKANWQQVFSGTGNITVTLPDGSQYSGPSWGNITSSLNNKPDMVSGAVPVSNGGTGAKTAQDARTALGVPTLNGSNEFTGIQTFNDVIKVKTSVTSGNAHLWFYDGDGTKSRGVIFASPSSTGRISVRPDGATDGYSCSFDSAGKFTCATLSQTSDKRLKKEITQVTDALSKLLSLHGYTYRLRVTEDTWIDGAGVVAQELEKVLPCAVATSGEGMDIEGNIIQDAKSVDYSALAALYIEGIRELVTRVDSLEKEFESFKS